MGSAQNPFNDTINLQGHSYIPSSSNLVSSSTDETRRRLNDLAVESIAAHLYNRAIDHQWFNPSAALSGVTIRKNQTQANDEQYFVMPDEGEQAQLFQEIAAFLRCQVAMMVSSDVVASLTAKMVPNTAEIPLSHNDGSQALRIQVLESLQDFQSLRRSQKAAFFRAEGLLLIWDSDAFSLEEEGLDLEERMVNFIWQTAAPKMKLGFEQDRTIHLWKREQAKVKEDQINQFHIQCETQLSSSTFSQIAGDEKREPNPTFGREITSQSEFAKKVDEEVSESDLYVRPTVPLASIHAALSVSLCIVILGISGGGSCITYFLKSGDSMSLLFLLCLPILFCISLFPSFSIVTTLFLLIGPISPMHRNTRYYSAKPVKRLTQNLPHITIQLPVYKENLQSVLVPTIESLSKAIRTYELQGGSANILISEDGLNLLSKTERKARTDYYDNMDVSWVARPKHGETYIRKGRFKKASNLNFTCDLALKVERFIDENTSSDLTAAQTKRIAESCVEDLVKRLHPEAEAKGDVRIGDLVLLVDSDTRVPIDCLLDSASEMSRCPDVAVLQHASGVLLSDKPNYFEKGIAFFTQLVNWSISFSISYGQVPPFMGHNAFLRWSALQEVAERPEQTEGADSERQSEEVRVWADNMVSEDFDMALKLVTKGYTIRWATYSNGGFLEGVSLTHIDELNRWQKYAYGASEIIFNPFKSWFRRGPLAKTFRTFLWSNCPIFYKFSACSYIFSYYAIAAGLPMTVCLSLLGGWYNADLLPMYYSSTPFKIFVTVIIIYVLLNPLCLAIGQSRSRSKAPFKALLDVVKWTPFCIIFFASMSYHISTALLSHILGINMSWSATIKEVGESHLFIELPILFKRFWRIDLISFSIIAGFSVLSLHFLPYEWQISSFTYIVPPIYFGAMHIMGPLLLDPALLRFSF